MFGYVWQWSVGLGSFYTVKSLFFSFSLARVSRPYRTQCQRPAVRRGSLCTGRVLNHLARKNLHYGKKPVYVPGRAQVLTTLYSQVVLIHRYPIDRHIFHRFTRRGRRAGRDCYGSGRNSRGTQQAATPQLASHNAIQHLPCYVRRSMELNIGKAVDCFSCFSVA